MTPMVVDASMAMAWCFEDESTPTTDQVLDRLAVTGAVVPTLWWFEVANVLVVAERRGRITESAVIRFLELLGQLPIRDDEAPTDAHTLIATGRRHGLSAYDAAYLALAERLGAPLATLDARLIGAARNAGVVTVGH
jgi:predicted nucleic acid-binding protein